MGPDTYLLVLPRTVLLRGLNYRALLNQRQDSLFTRS